MNWNLRIYLKLMLSRCLIFFIDKLFVTLEKGVVRLGKHSKFLWDSYSLRTSFSTIKVDVITLNGIMFGDQVKRVYPIELEVKDTWFIQFLLLTD